MYAPHYQGSFNNGKAEIKKISKNKNIIAMDVCGDGSTSSCIDWSIKDIFRRVKDNSLEEGFFERPENIVINAITNIKIFEAVKSSSIAVPNHTCVAE